MSNNYLRNNPVANQLSIDTFKLYENKDVDYVLKISIDTLLAACKKIIFDFASDRNRNYESFSKKIEMIGDTSTIKGLIANIKDVCEDTELHDSILAPLKKSYLDSIESYPKF
jgi:hypothetical protein